MKQALRRIVPDSILWNIRKTLGQVRSVGKPKIFGIGNNKTGSTSLKAAMEELGFIVGHQRTAEKLVEDWAKRDFSSIIQYCKSAQFFQDVPFSKPYTFVVLDHEFPDSQYILTVRDSPEQWYNSLTEFHAKLWGKAGRIPTKEDLQEATYIYKGRPWDTRNWVYDVPPDDPYNKDILIKHYQDYNQSIKEYFRHRPDDLLVLNVAEKGAYQKLCDFLDIQSDREEFPWKNKTQ